MISFQSLYEQLKAAGMTKEQATIIANELTNIKQRLKTIEDGIGNLHSELDIGFAGTDERIKEKFEKVMKEIKEIKEIYK